MRFSFCAKEKAQAGTPVPPISRFVGRSVFEPRRAGGFRVCRDDVDVATSEHDFAFAHAVERVVGAHADVESGLERSTDLTDDDRAGLGGFATVELDAAVLRVGVAAVLG